VPHSTFENPLLENLFLLSFISGTGSFYFIANPGSRTLLFLSRIWNPLILIADPEGFRHFYYPS